MPTKKNDDGRPLNSSSPRLAGPTRRRKDPDAAAVRVLFFVKETKIKQEEKEILFTIEPPTSDMFFFPRRLNLSFFLSLYSTLQTQHKQPDLLPPLVPLALRRVRHVDGRGNDRRRFRLRPARGVLPEQRRVVGKRRRRRHRRVAVARRRRRRQRRRRRRRRRRGDVRGSAPVRVSVSVLSISFQHRGGVGVHPVLRARRARAARAPAALGRRRRRPRRRRRRLGAVGGGQRRRGGAGRRGDAAEV